MEPILIILVVLLGVALSILWVILPVVVFRINQKVSRLETMLNMIEWNTRPRGRE